MKRLGLLTHVSLSLYKLSKFPLDLHAGFVKKIQFADLVKGSYKISGRYCTVTVSAVMAKSL